MVFDSVAYKNVVSNGLVLDKNGQKMSKRLGNATDPFETLATYGADATRWYMISNANPWDNLKFDLPKESKKSIESFLAHYTIRIHFSPSMQISINLVMLRTIFPLEERPEIDRWILIRITLTNRKSGCVLCRL